MADNTVLNTGTGGDTIASDDVGGVKHQRVKAEWGADGVANDADVADGKGLPVQGNNRVASGALGALNAAVTISGHGAGTIHFEIDTGTLAGTVVAEATLDDATWFSVNVIENDGTISSSFTVFGKRGVFVTGGYSQVRLRVSAYTSGTSNARLEASPSGAVVRLGQASVAVTHAAASQADGHSTTLGATGDADTANTVIGRLKQIITRLAGGLPAALVGGRLDVNVGNTPTVTANAGSGTFATDQANAAEADYDTGAGTVNQVMFGLGLPGAGGPVAGGTATNPVRTDPTGTTTQPVSGTVTANAGTGTFGTNVAQVGGTAAVDGGLAGTLGIGGARAHDAAGASNPVVAGAEMIAHGANPTAGTAGRVTKTYANRHGIPFSLGGHPNLITRRDNFTAAQTDVALVTVAAGTKIVVVSQSVTADKANTVDVAARTGFGATTTPTGVGVVLSHPGIAAGSGMTEPHGGDIAGIGADGEDLRITSEVPTGGSIDVVTKYFTIES